VYEPIITFDTVIDVDAPEVILGALLRTTTLATLACMVAPDVMVGSLDSTLTIDLVGEVMAATPTDGLLVLTRTLIVSPI